MMVASDVSVAVGVNGDGPGSAHPGRQEQGAARRLDQGAPYETRRHLRREVGDIAFADLVHFAEGIPSD